MSKVGLKLNFIIVGAALLLTTGCGSSYTESEVQEAAVSEPTSNDLVAEKSNLKIINKKLKKIVKQIDLVKVTLADLMSYDMFTKTKVETRTPKVSEIQGQIDVALEKIKVEIKSLRSILDPLASEHLKIPVQVDRKKLLAQIKKLEDLAFSEPAGKLFSVKNIFVMKFEEFTRGSVKTKQFGQIQDMLREIKDYVIEVRMEVMFWMK